MALGWPGYCSESRASIYYRVWTMMTYDDDIVRLYAYCLLDGGLGYPWIGSINVRRRGGYG